MSHRSLFAPALCAGLASVSKGPGLGGAINADLKSSAFGKDDAFHLGADISAQGSTVNEAGGGGGIVTLANESQRFPILGDYEQGGVRFCRYRPSDGQFLDAPVTSRYTAH